MNDDCEQCREWEICPFHSDEEQATAASNEATSRSMFDLDDEVPTVRSTGIVRVSSADGETVLTYDNGRLINEEPVEAYTDWGMGCGCNSCVRLWANVRALRDGAGATSLEVDYSGCMAIGVGGYHSEHYGDPGDCCQWCGANQEE